MKRLISREARDGPGAADGDVAVQERREARKLQAVLDRYANARPKHLAEHAAPPGSNNQVTQSNKRP